MLIKARKPFNNNGPERLIMGVMLVGVILIAFGYSLYALTTSTEPVVEEKNVVHSEFVQQLAPHAKELQEQYGILPSIILGQAILESNWGESSLASKYNNLFGIKASEGEKSVTLSTQEFVNEEWITIDGDFRVYNSWEESMNDHTLLFANGVSWNPDLYQSVLTASTYQEAAQALQDSGYATDPNYASKVISVIEENQLDQFDK